MSLNKNNGGSMNLIKIVTLAAIVSAGLFAATNNWTGVNTFNYNSIHIKNQTGAYNVTLTLDAQGKGNYSAHIPKLLEAETIAFVPQSNNTVPANQSSTSSASSVMYGGYITLTPKLTGNVEVSVSGTAASSLLGDGCRIDVRYNSTNLGANGAAVTGTVIGNNIKLTAGVDNEILHFSQDYPVKSLTTGQKYYFDLSQSAITGGSCTITNVKWFVKEY